MFSQDNPTEFAWATGTEALDALDTLLDSCCLNSAQGSTGAISGQLFSQGDQTNFILAYTDSTYGPDVPPDQYPQGLTHGQCV